MPQFESHFFSSLIFWEILSFGILFFLLYKYAFPSLLGMLEEREKKIKDSLDQAERHRSTKPSLLMKKSSDCSRLETRIMVWRYFMWLPFG